MGHARDPRLLTPYNTRFSCACVRTSVYKDPLESAAAQRFVRLGKFPFRNAREQVESSISPVWMSGPGFCENYATFPRSSRFSASITAIRMKAFFLTPRISYPFAWFIIDGISNLLLYVLGEAVDRCRGIYGKLCFCGWLCSNSLWMGLNKFAASFLMLELYLVQISQVIWFKYLHSKFVFMEIQWRIWTRLTQRVIN